MEKAAKKKKNKKYEHTFDDQIKRLEDKDQIGDAENKQDDEVKIADENGIPSDLLDPNSYISPLRAQFIEYKDLTKDLELIVKQYPRKVKAFYYVNRMNAEYTDGIEHYTADWLKIPAG